MPVNSPYFVSTPQAYPQSSVDRLPPWAINPMLPQSQQPLNPAPTTGGATTPGAVDWNQLSVQFGGIAPGIWNVIGMMTGMTPEQIQSYMTANMGGAGMGGPAPGQVANQTTTTVAGGNVPSGAAGAPVGVTPPAATPIDMNKLYGSLPTGSASDWLNAYGVRTGMSQGAYGGQAGPSQSNQAAGSNYIGGNF